MPDFGISSERSDIAVTTALGFNSDVLKVLLRFRIDIATLSGIESSSGL